MPSILSLWSRTRHGGKCAWLQIQSWAFPQACLDSENPHAALEPFQGGLCAVSLWRHKHGIHYTSLIKEDTANEVTRNIIVSLDTHGSFLGYAWQRGKQHFGHTSVSSHFVSSNKQRQKRRKGGGIVSEVDQQNLWCRRILFTVSLAVGMR